MKAKTCHFFEIYFRVRCGKELWNGPLWEQFTKVPRGVSLFRADLGFVVATLGREDFAMHEWMMGVGFIAILMTPCLIAMRPGADDADDKHDNQETAGLPSARRLKLL
jgi:hypothetical protein